LRAAEGMGEIIASLPKNPLPDAFIVEPADTQPAAMEALAATFAEWPKVEHVQLDSAWSKRFDAFLRIGKLVVTLIAGVFAAALVAATFNTIRLQIMANAAEIEVARFVGATDAFIRRPFQYFGALQGGCGGLLAAAARLCRGTAADRTGRRTGRALRWRLRPARALARQHRRTRRRRRGARLARRAALGRHSPAALGLK
jgi:cell division transport system permease protein